MANGKLVRGRFTGAGAARFIQMLAVSTAVLMTLSLASPARAYEGDHYSLTYYLALQLGFTKRQAFQIASGAYALDWDEHTGPMKATPGDVFVGAGHTVPVVPEFGKQPVSTIDSPSEKDAPFPSNASHPRIASIWSEFHAFADENLLNGCNFEWQHETTSGKCGDAIMELSERLGPDQVPPPCSSEVAAAVAASRARRKEALWLLTMAERNPGVLLHFAQDFYPHFRYDTFRGHAIEGHFPDYISSDRPKALCATSDSLQILTAFRAYLGTFVDDPGQSLLPQKPRQPDMQRIGQVLQELIRVNPSPRLNKEGLQNWNPSGPGRAAPKLENSVAVVIRAIKEDEENRRLPSWPEEYDGNQTMPVAWMQYAYSPEGRIQIVGGGTDERGPVEKIGVEFKKEIIDIQPDELNSDKVKIHLKLPYTITGVTDLQDRTGAYFLSPIPVIEKHELSDDPSFLYKQIQHRRSGDYEAEIHEDIKRNKADLDAGKIEWTASIQVYGYEPKEKKIKLRRGRCTPQTGPLLEAMSVSNDWPGAQAMSKHHLEEGKCYTVEVIGHRLGTDAIYCFFDWRCTGQNPAAWQEFTLDGFGLNDASGGVIAYDASHDYSVGYEGKGKPLTARFSSHDDTGEIYKQNRGSRTDGCTRSGADPNACFYQVKIYGPQ